MAELPAPLPQGFTPVGEPEAPKQGLPAPLPRGFQPVEAPGQASFARPALGDTAAARGEDTRGWGRWAYDTVVGRQDPRYKGLPSLDQALSDELEAKGATINSPEMRNIRMGTVSGADDKSYGDIMQSALGNRFVKREPDQHGYEVVTYLGEDGTEKQAYVNRPGLDLEDVTRGIYQAAPYVAGGVLGGAAKAGLFGRAALQGVVGAGTSVGQDVVAGQLGSQQGIDPVKAALTGGLSFAGEMAAPAVAAAYRRFVTEPGLYDAVKQQLTPKGVTIAVEAGLDPNALKGKLAQEFTKTYAKTGDAALAGRQLAQSELGIESTIGQRTKDWDRLFEEEAMRKGLRGDAAKRVMKDFDERQAAQVRNAIIGNPDEAGAANIPGQRGLAASVNPNRDVNYLRPQDLGTPIQEGLQTARQTAKRAESEAWQGLHEITASQQALDEFLPQFVGRAIQDVDPQLTPNAYRMVELLHDYQQGSLARDPLLQKFGQVDRPTVDGIRRRLLAFMDNAPPGSPDKRAASQLYRAYDDWLGASADAHLLSGHPDAAMAIRNARGISREIKDLFAPRGNEKQAGNIISRIMDKADSPEAVVNAVVGNGPQGKIQPGSVGAMTRIKTALETHGGAEGQAAWNDIRSAYLMRMVNGSNGQIMGPQAMLTSFRKMFEQQESLARVLYSPQELQQMRKFMKSLEDITYKPPNPSGSAYGVIQGVKDMFSMLLNAIPGAEKVKVPLHIAWKMTGVPSAKEVMAARAADRAVRPGLPTAQSPSFGGYSGAFGNALYGKD